MRKTLIIYQSSHGNTEQILKEIINHLDRKEYQVAMQRLKETTASDLTAYDQIVLGGSIHAGSIQKEVKSFIKNQRELLLQKPLALFVGCLDKEKALDFLNDSFPDDLKAHAQLKTCIGGRLETTKLPFILRPLMKVMVKKEEDKIFDCQEGRDKLLTFIQGK